MAENLKTTKYNDGTAIPLVTDNNTWHYLTTPGFCWYDNDSTTNKNRYGALYNFYSVLTGKLCPAGWRVPTRAEWFTLITYLGGESVTGGKLKETGTTHWLSPNEGATNETGFTALPGGYRDYNGIFDFIRETGYLWSSTRSQFTTLPYYSNLSYSTPSVSVLSSPTPAGHSVRCIKD